MLNIHEEIATVSAEMNSPKEVALHTVHILPTAFLTSYHREDEQKDQEHDQPRKELSFSPSVSIHSTLSREDFTTHEIRASWYSEQEYKDITQSCLKQIRKIENGHKLRDLKYCKRGLESYTKVGSLQKKRNRTNAIHAVLEEQDHQIRLDILDEDAIASVYYDASSSCQMWAHRLGLLDEREAEIEEEMPQTQKSVKAARAA